MKKVILASLILVLLILPILASESGDYILDSGDRLIIMVRGVEELSNVPVMVREDGRFSFPYAGEVMARGLTIPELENVLQNRLTNYLKNPGVQVLLQEERGLMVGIFGEVIQAGNFKVPAGSNLISALAFAGGPKLDSARLRSVRIYHQDGTFRKVNLRHLLSHPEDADKYPINEGDVIFVPKRFFSWELQTILQILSVVSITIGIQEALKD